MTNHRCRDKQSNAGSHQQCTCPGTANPGYGDVSMALPRGAKPWGAQQVEKPCLKIPICLVRLAVKNATAAVLDLRLPIGTISKLSTSVSSSSLPAWRRLCTLFPSPRRLPQPLVTLRPRKRELGRRRNCARSFRRSRMIRLGGRSWRRSCKTIAAVIALARPGIRHCS